MKLSQIFRAAILGSRLAVFGLLVSVSPVIGAKASSAAQIPVSGNTYQQTIIAEDDTMDDSGSDDTMDDGGDDAGDAGDDGGDDQ